MIQRKIFLSRFVVFLLLKLGAVINTCEKLQKLRMQNEMEQQDLTFRLILAGPLCPIRKLDQNHGSYFTSVNFLCKILHSELCVFIE